MVLDREKRKNKNFKLWIWFDMIGDFDF